MHPPNFAIHKTAVTRNPWGSITAIISEYIMKNCYDNEKAYMEYQGALEYLKANYEREIENSNMFSYSL